MKTTSQLIVSGIAAAAVAPVAFAQIINGGANSAPAEDHTLAYVIVGVVVVAIVVFLVARSRNKK